jgi:two-component system, chemotaxis family, protein-glutamate methylesterase/glutaminase
MPGHDIIVVGASAGGVEALTYLAKKLPKDIKAAILIVLHVPAQGTSVLPRILTRAGNLPALHPKNGEEIVPGKIYIAPPNYHLLVQPGHIHLSRGARENSHRPAIDPLFRSAARAYGRRVVAVVLTGVLDDGTAGLMAVKMRNGVGVVQNPEDAMYGGMPQSAIANVDNIDYILPLADIPDMLVNLANTPVEGEAENPVSEGMKIETDLLELDMKTLNQDDRPGKPSTFACPSCGGTLWEHQERDLLRFRCRTGHAFSAESLMAEQSEALEDALWIALRALEEKSSLAHRIAKRMRDRNQLLSAEKLEEDARDSNERADIIRQVLARNEVTIEDKMNSNSGNQEASDDN